MNRRSKFSNIRGAAWFPDADISGNYQSQLERRGVVHVLLDPVTASARLQAPRIHYRDASGRRRRYTGDCLVHFTAALERRPLVIEYKFADELREDPGLREKLRRVEATLVEAGYQFVVRVEEDVVTADFPAKEFIAGYFNDAPMGWEEQFRQILERRGRLTVAELLGECAQDPVRQLHLLPAVWRYVARRQAFIDFGRMPDQRTVLFVKPPQQGADL